VREPLPIHAEGFFVMGIDGTVNQVTIFEYLDEDGYYRKLIKDREALLKS
jgi:hypothetical protein